jgi:cell division septum initiation protein DivIVA
MTKAQEIEALDKFVRSLPKDSYLWPWLVQVEAEVVADIRNDVMVSPSIAATREQCEQRVLKAEGEANAIIAKAEADARRIETEAREESQSIRSRLQEMLRTIHTAAYS